jgi:hypothetical protein
MENKIYQPFVLSMKLEKAGESFSLPIIFLGSDEKLVLHFDDDVEDTRYYKYTFIHCTYDWKPTPYLQPYEYLSGFTYGEIINFQHSFTTVQKYITHTLIFPNDDINFLLSGNYILYIYNDDNNVCKPILTYRFTVAESQIEINAEVLQASNIATRYTHQELSLSINTSNFPVHNPRENLKLWVSQNGRHDNALILSNPTSVMPNMLTYNRPGEIEFEGGCEFRIFNIRTLRTPMEHVTRHVYMDNQNHSYLETDKQRSFLAYDKYQDINGCYFLAADDALSAQTLGNDVLNRQKKHTYTPIDNITPHPEADYTNVHFTYYCDNFPDRDIYIFGELTNWTFLPDAKLLFSEHKKRWETSIYLKTGYYNYTYLTIDRKKNTSTFTDTEGNHWETENRYTILAYYHGNGLLYDRVIGYQQCFSGGK